MPHRLLSVNVAAMLVAACGTSEPSPSVVITPGPTEAATATAPPASTSAPTVAPTPTSPFAGQPYSMDLPDGWTIFDLADPAGSAALDAFVAANPEMAGPIEAFKALPGVTMAINPVLANVVVSLAVPTGGLTLEVLATSFTAQFAAVPGVVTPPQPNDVVLPAGPAVHWDITIEANNPGGGTNQVHESVYLIANDTTAVLVEFVEVTGAGIPQEAQIIQSFRFTP
jgi:hypothetical protein